MEAEFAFFLILLSVSFLFLPQLKFKGNSRFFIPSEKGKSFCRLTSKSLLATKTEADQERRK